MSEKTKRIVWRNVTSRNPDKPRIVAALRAAAGVTGGKVTSVSVSKDGTQIAGHVLVRRPGRRTYETVGEIVCAFPG